MVNLERNRLLLAVVLVLGVGCQDAGGRRRAQGGGGGSGGGGDVVSEGEGEGQGGEGEGEGPVGEGEGEGPVGEGEGEGPVGEGEGEGPVGEGEGEGEGPVGEGEGEGPVGEGEGEGEGEQQLCQDTCGPRNDGQWAGDGECDDGGPDSEYDVCPLGMDCEDCGPRAIGGGGGNGGDNGGGGGDGEPLEPGRDLDEDDPHIRQCLEGEHADEDPLRWEACLMLQFVNADRAHFADEAGGAGPLAWNEDLWLVAVTHSQDMCRRNFFDHTNPDGQGPTDRSNAAGFDYRVAENIAVNYDVAATEHAFMAEPTCTGHRGNILSPSNVAVGIGLYTCDNDDGRWDGYLHATQNFDGGGERGESAYCRNPALSCELPPNPVSTASDDCPARLVEWGWCEYDEDAIMEPIWDCPED